MPVLFFHEPRAELVVSCLVIGMMCAGCFVLSTMPLAVIAMLVPMTAGIGAALVREQSVVHALVFLLFVSYAVMLLVAVTTYANQFVSRVVAQVEAEHAAAIDPLTALTNRKGLMERLAAEAARVARGGAGFGLISFDLDGFKPVNDRLGHGFDAQEQKHDT